MTAKHTRMWTILLTVLFLFATFEDNFTTLKLYSAGWTVYGIDLSALSKFVLVLGIDLAIYFSIAYVVSRRAADKPFFPAAIILLFNTVISIGLNVFYMITYSPEGPYAKEIGITVGVLIPFMLLLLGWIDGQGGEVNEMSSGRPRIKNARIAARRFPVTAEYPQKKEPVNDPKPETFKPVPNPIPDPIPEIKPVVKPRAKPKQQKDGANLEGRILRLIKNDRTQSDRSIARQVECSPTTVGKVRKKYNLYV